jgi:hypothetical protein
LLLKYQSKQKYIQDLQNELSTRAMAKELVAPVALIRELKSVTDTINTAASVQRVKVGDVAPMAASCASLPGQIADSPTFEAHEVSSIDTKAFNPDLKSDRLKMLFNMTTSIEDKADSLYLNRVALATLYSFFENDFDEMKVFPAQRAVIACGASKGQLQKILNYFQDYSDQGLPVKVLLNRAAIQAGDQTLAGLELQWWDETFADSSEGRFQHLIWTLLFSDYQVTEPKLNLKTEPLAQLVRFIEGSQPSVRIFHVNGALKTANGTSKQLIDFLRAYGTLRGEKVSIDEAMVKAVDLP